MSTDHNTPLFEISDGDEIEYEDDPAVAQAKVNLVAAEQIQQEREEQKAQAEVEREQRELEEAELGWLTLEKERLEEEACVERQCTEVLHGSERVAERH